MAARRARGSARTNLRVCEAHRLSDARVGIDRCGWTGDGGWERVIVRARSQGGQRRNANQRTSVEQHYGIPLSKMVPLTRILSVVSDAALAQRAPTALTSRFPERQPTSGNMHLQ